MEGIYQNVMKIFSMHPTPPPLEIETETQT